jgi:DNA polymerase-3 subunit gamma/tau
MSYLVLARKYRPKSFTEMVGQPHVVQALTNALEQQRLHHAYLFTGTRGVGKTTVSRILAKSLNCVGPDGQGQITAAPCGVCQSCRDIDAGRFVDYTELDAASNRSVDEVQALLEQAVYKPVQGRFKVFMIDEVHMLTGHAFNAMLKTLEEPPAYLKFVLATTDPQKVPVTVLSRCLQFNLRPMAPETIAEHLGQVLQAEHIAAQEQALHLIAKAARGSMRDALSLTDQAIAFGAGHIQTQAVAQMLGTVGQELVLQLLQALSRADGVALVQGVNVLREQGLSAAQALEDMTVALQQMAVLQLAAGAASAQDDALQALANALSPPQTQLLYSLCVHGRAELGLMSDEYAAMTMVLLRFLAFQKKTAPSLTSQAPPEPDQEKKTAKAEPEPSHLTAAATEPLVQAAQTQAHTQTQAEAAPVVASVRLLSETGADQEMVLPLRETQPEAVRTELHTQAQTMEKSPLGDDWAQLVQSLIDAEAITAVARELALQSQLLRKEAQVWHLAVEQASLTQPTAVERLTNALHAAGHSVRLSLSVAPVIDSLAKRQAAAMNQRMQAAMAAMASDPYIRSLVEQYGAREIPGSIRLRPLARVAEEAVSAALPVIDMRPANPAHAHTAAQAAGTLSH